MVAFSAYRRHPNAQLKRLIKLIVNPHEAKPFTLSVGGLNFQLLAAAAQAPASHPACADPPTATMRWYSLYTEGPGKE